MLEGEEGLEIVAGADDEVINELDLEDRGGGLYDPCGVVIGFGYLARWEGWLWARTKA